jgi:hypothetical protein
MKKEAAPMPEKKKPVVARVLVTAWFRFPSLAALEKAVQGEAAMTPRWRRVEGR